MNSARAQLTCLSLSSGYSEEAPCLLRYPRGAQLSPAAETVPLPPLDQFAARIEAILRRKGQVVLYGPPGTGKTYRALAVANELAARHAFRKSFVDLTESERKTVADGDGLVRVCTFHPGWGYEDFIEGLRPTTINGQMVFEPRDGIFKRLCARRDQANEPGTFSLSWMRSIVVTYHASLENYSRRSSTISGTGRSHYQSPVRSSPCPKRLPHRHDEHG